jgi:hypothetical protein
MLRLMSILYSMIATTLGGAAVVAVLTAGKVGAMPIIAAAVAGALVALPVSWFVAKQISAR